MPMASTKIDGKLFTVIDTPGIFESDKMNLEISKEMAQAISQCTCGIQAIIVVIEATRFTKEQRDTIDQVIKFLGKESLNNMFAVFTKCKKAPTINPDLLLNSLVPEQRDFLDSIGNRFIISLNLDIFNEPGDPIVMLHTKLKNYIVGFPNLYTTDVFKEVHRELREIEGRECRQMLENQAKPYHHYHHVGLTNIDTIKNILNIKDDEKCFAADPKVTLQNGKVIKISELVIRDYVCCGIENGKQVFSEVLLFIHADYNAVTEFQLIDFMKQNGTLGCYYINIYYLELFLIDFIYKGTLYVTPEHHIFVNDGGTDFAKNVIPNETQLFVSDGEKLVPVTATRIMKERRKGYYSPLTRSGTILVDEVLCSCYASAPPYQSLFNLALVPLKIYTKIFPPKYLNKEIHPYVKFLDRGRKIVEFLDYLNIPRSLQFKRKWVC